MNQKARIPDAIASSRHDRNVVPINDMTLMIWSSKQDDAMQKIS